MTYPHLAHLNFRQIPPHPVLRDYVRSYWVIDNAANVDEPVDEFMHPGGATGIIFNLRDTVSLDETEVTDRYFLDGANKTSKRLSTNGVVHAMGIRFTVTGTFALHGIPMCELLSDALVYAPGNFKALDSLHDRLVNTEKMETRIAHLENWLLSSLDEVRETPATVKQSLPLIDASQGQLPVAQLSDELFISERQLERLFKTHIGISPKHYARLQRVSQARNQLKQIDDVTLLEAAQNAGYYDQSHFIRAFKAIVGMTPGAYRERIEARNHKLRER